MRKKVKNNKGFTLIEMLVVVLIIGILAAVALPQYKKSVEKAKLTEVLENIAVIEGAAQRYMLAHPESESVNLKDFLDVDLSGGEWDEWGATYTTKDFDYTVWLTSDGYAAEIYPLNGNYGFQKFDYEKKMKCYTQYTDIGRYICKYLETQGFEYYEDEI